MGSLLVGFTPLCAAGFAGWGVLKWWLPQVFHTVSRAHTPQGGEFEFVKGMLDRFDSGLAADVGGTDCALFSHFLACLVSYS